MFGSVARVRSMLTERITSKRPSCRATSDTAGYLAWYHTFDDTSAYNDERNTRYSESIIACVSIKLLLRMSNAVECFDKRSKL